MSKPTLEQYEEAKRNFNFCEYILKNEHSLRMKNDRQTRLIDALCDEKPKVSECLSLMRKYRKIINIYESYEKIEQEWQI